MATKFYNNNWRMPRNANQSKASNFSMEFDGTDDYIDCGTISALNGGITAFSVSCWINPSATTSNVIISGGDSTSDDFYIQIVNSTTIRYGSGSQYDDFTISALSTGTWYHLVTVHNGTNLELYIDGTSVGTATVLAPTNDIGTDLIIGDYQISGSGFEYAGKMDEVAIFDYALTAGNVTTLYGNSTDGVGNPMALDPKPKAYYPLGDYAAYNGTNYLINNGALSDYVFDFDGSNDDQINLSSAISSASEFTLSYWANPTSTGGLNSYIIAQAAVNHNYIQHNQIARIKVQIDSSATTFIEAAGNDLVLNTWQHILITRDSSNIVKVYRNGTAFGAASSAMTGTFSIDQIGCFVNLYGYDGLISNVAWWTSDQTANIATIYNNGTPSDITSLSPISWWKLDASATFDGTNWSIPDDSTNSNTGTSGNMTAANLVQSSLNITTPFSRYALDFDGTNDHIDLGDDIAILKPTGAFSISLWVKSDSISTYQGLFTATPASTAGGYWLVFNGSNARFGIHDGAGIEWVLSATLSSDTWYHIVGVWDGSSTSNIYVNTVASTSPNTGVASINYSGTIQHLIGDYAGLELNGQMSQVSFFNSALTVGEITTLYNEGKPSDLSSFSPAPIAWWQLGENSYYDGSDWIVLDEIGTINGTSSGMSEDDLVNGVQTTANGVSSGMGTTNIKGDAPYSTNNAISYNMGVTARETSTP